MLTDCTTGPNFGGNNRARTCDLLLVRQMLSQLSYAPKSSEVLRTSATWIIIHTKGTFVKNFFDFFAKNFIAPFFVVFPKKPGKS